MKSTKLTKAQEKALRDQVITDDQPGPVLRDFRTLLEFLGPEGVEAGGKHYLLPIKIIDELDGRLSRPLRLELKRPQIRSHPYIQGLNLLLRASGLVQVHRSGAKARLVPDPALLAQWERLNTTEQYFQLLEAWLRLGRAEMVGESSGHGGSLLSSVLMAWKTLPEDGFRLDPGRDRYDYVPGFYGNLYLLALIDLFGLLKVKQSSRPVTPWRPAVVAHTPFGEALLTLLARFELASLFGEDEDREEPAEGQPRFGAWRTLFHPYFPEWKENLEFPRPELRKGESIFRVSLGKIWRRIAMPADSTLGDLVTLILRSVKFDSDHLYEFRYTDRRGASLAATDPRMSEGPWADDITIGSLPLDPGQEMQLTYDFGDCWKFTIKLERVEESKPKAKKPRILESHGEPPEQYPDWDE